MRINQLRSHRGGTATGYGVGRNALSTYRQQRGVVFSIISANMETCLVETLLFPNSCVSSQNLHSELLRNQVLSPF